MFHRPKPSVPLNIKPLHSLTPILSAEQLLADSKRQQLLKAIAETSQFEISDYNRLAVPVIHQVAYAYQRLPGNNLYFSNPGGLLDRALSRTQAATKLLREYLLPPPFSRLSDDQKRWWYALFSASILRGIGTLCVEYRINRYSIKGQFLKPWEPLFENMGQINHHYSYEFLTNETPRTMQRLTLLMAYRLMPEEGLIFLAENKDIFAIWLALLDEDEEGSKALGAILDRADAIVIQEELQGLVLRTGVAKRSNIGISTFIDPATLTEQGIEKELTPGLEFLKWLQNKIETGLFLLNKAPIFMVPGGILICIEAFQLFSKEHIHYKNWHAVQQSFSSLKIHLLTQGKALNQYEQGHGLLTKSSIVLPETLSIVHSKTGEIQKTTATALAIGETGLHISPQGDWIMEKTPPRPSFGPQTGGSHGS